MRYFSCLKAFCAGIFNPRKSASSTKKHWSAAFPIHFFTLLLSVWSLFSWSDYFFPTFWLEFFFLQNYNTFACNCQNHNLLLLHSEVYCSENTCQHAPNFIRCKFCVNGHLKIVFENIQDLNLIVQFPALII